MERQAALFTGSRDVSRVTIADTGHALTLHRSRDEFSAQVANRLAARGFSGPRPTAALQLR